MKIICTKKEKNNLLNILPCKENDDFGYFYHCKFRHKYNDNIEEIIEEPTEIFTNCEDCVTYHNNIEWEIKEE